jgi:N-acetylglucosamine-6-phosphate deacetylase
VRRLASWGVPAEQAIAAATLTPRRVLGERRSAAELLLGRPLDDTLRWSQASEGLSWRRAGRRATNRCE